MFIIIKKIHRGRLTASAILLALTLAAVGAGGYLAQDIQAVMGPVGDQPEVTGIKTNQDRVAYLQALGWIVGEEAAAVEELLIPETFDESYQDYLALQQSQGFDLTKYAGKTVKRYTYAVKNYPGLQENIWASLLIYKKTIIGGEISCPQGDGFTQSLTYPVQSST